MPVHTTNQIERNIAKCNIIKNIRKLFKLEKKKDNHINDEILRKVRNLFKLEKKKDNGIKDRILKDTRPLFESE